MTPKAEAPLDALPHLIVIRISDSSALADLLKKVHETAALYSSIPGMSVLAKLGVQPMLEPRIVDARSYTLPGFRACYFRLPGTRTGVLMALGSATKAQFGTDDNAFVSLLSDILAEAKVEAVCVADFSRLLRSIDYLSDTWKALRTRCRYVRHGGNVIDTAGATAEIQFLFEALSAAADARFTVKRTLNGKMRAFLGGKCPFSAEAVPLGYRRTNKRTLVSDPRQKQVIRTIVRVLGDPSLTNRERLEQVRAVERAESRSRSGCRLVPDPDRANPSDVVTRWYRMLDVWKAGRWVVEHDIPSILHSVEFDLPVDIREHNGNRVWRAVFELGLPAEGWATSEEFEAAIALRDRRQALRTPAGGISAGRRRKPLCGLPSWDWDGHNYGLLSYGLGRYELRRRPLEEAYEVRREEGFSRRVNKGWGRRPKLAGEHVAVLDAGYLHQQIAEAMVEAATQGLAVHSGTEALLETATELGHELREQLARHRRTAANARRNANEAATEDERREYLRDATAATAAATQLEQDLLHLVSSTPGQHVPVSVDDIATALASLANSEDHVPGEVADAVRTVFRDLKILPDDETTARWQASLRVPMSGGALSLGPARGVLDLGHGRARSARRNATLAERAGEAAELYMKKGHSIAETAAHLEITTKRRVAQTIRDYLKDLGLSAKAATTIVAVTPTPAREAVWAHLHQRPHPRSLTPAFAQHAVRCYEKDTSWPHVAPAHQWMRLRVIDAVRAAGGWVAPGEVRQVADEAGVSVHTLTHTLARGRHRSGLWRPQVLRLVDHGIGLLPCAQEDCDGWASVVAVLPEVPAHVLCDVCLRMPDATPGLPAFPAAYRDLPMNVTASYAAG